MPKRGVFSRDEGCHHCDVPDNIAILISFLLTRYGNGTSWISENIKVDFEYKFCFKFEPCS